MKKIATCISAVALVLCLAMGTAFAATNLPAIPKTGLVIDEANVLSDETQQTVNNLSAALGDACGAQIAVATVDFTGQSNIDDYTYDLFDAWGIGSASKDNGVLLLLVIGEQDYMCIFGTGLEKSLTASRLDTLLWDNLEDGFAKGDYDAGVTKFATAMYNELCAIYNVIPSLADGNQGNQGNAGSSNATKGSGFFASSFGILLLLGLILLVLAVITSSLSRNHRRTYTNTVYVQPPRRSFWRPYHTHHRAPPPPPSHYGGHRPPSGGLFGGSRPPSSHHSGGGLFGGGSRPSGGGGSSFGSGSSRSSASRSSSSRPSGSSRSSSPRAGGGSSRGAGAGRRR